MMKSKNKTTETEGSVTEYISAIADNAKRENITALILIMQHQTSLPPKMWGAAIVGFGSYHYKYESGREGDAPIIGLSARANAITLYLGTFEEKEELLKKLGKHKEGKGCVYIKKLEGIDTEVWGKMIALSYQSHRQKYSS